jgi:tRNA (cmo5U34)-methyltransferase
LESSLYCLGSFQLWLSIYRTAPINVLDYLGRADSIAHRKEGESTQLEFIPRRMRRFLDLATRDGRLLALAKHAHRETEAVAIDFSPTMIEAAKKTLRQRRFS